MTRPARLTRSMRSLVALLLLALVGPGDARATFHFMSISELGAGFLGNPNVQFVELRLDAAGQNEVRNTRLTSFDKDGIATVLLLTPTDVANGQSGRNVLYATAEFQTATGITPDFVIPVGVVGPAGMICWGAPGTTPPMEPSSWDENKPENYVDCVAYGSYAHGTRPASGTPSALTPGDGTRSLTREKNTSSAGSNATDFALATATACNNANQCATLSPGPTPTPGGDVTPGKAERACRRAILRAGTAFAATYGKLIVGCETQRLKGKLTGACPDAKTLTKIAAADAKRTKVITKACGALPVTMTGFGATCPSFTGGCADAIGSVADVSACVDCGLRRAGDELGATVYGATPDPAILKCQLATGKAAVGHARAVASLLARCEDGVARGKIAAPCPDPKTATKLADKATKLRKTLCAACGGKDKVCGGDGDATPTALGITSCPARTIPAGAACADPAITDLAGVVACVECLATFEGTCGTQLVATPATIAPSCTTP